LHDLFIILREKTHAYTNMPFLFITYLLYWEKKLTHTTICHFYVSVIYYIEEEKSRI